MILQEEYNLNLESQLSKKYVKVSQYDTGRRLLITLLKNDCSMFKIPSEASASINGLKPDGKGFRYDCSIENNKVVVDMKEQMTVLAGCVKCEILLSKGGERIATANFMLSVEESPLSENTPISSTDIPLLQKAIEASETVLSVEKTVKGYSESASKSSQSAQESAESASNASASSAESARNSSQSAQASAESANSASQSATNAQESAESASNSARESKTSADSAIQTKTEVEQLKQETVEQTKTLTDSAKQEISTVKDATVTEVTELKNSTVSEITSLKDSTIEAVTLLKDNAKAEADRATESSTSAKAQAEKAKASADSIANVTSDVEKLKEDLPNKITKFYASNQGETHITDSDNGKIQDMMIYGKSNQNQTKGKNLLKYPYIETTKPSNGITFTDNKDGSINVSGTGTETAYYNFYSNSDGKYLTLASGTYKLVAKGRSKCNVFVNNGVNSAKNEGTFTITDGHNDVWCFIEAPKGLAINETIYPMIQLASSTDESYEPYTGGKPSPNPDYPQEIKSVVNPTVKACGANILRLNDIEEATFTKFGVTLSVKDGVIKVKGTVLTNANIKANISSSINIVDPLTLQSGETYIYNPNPIKGAESSNCFLDFTNSRTFGASLPNEMINKPFKLTDLKAQFPFFLIVTLKKGTVVDIEWKPQLLLNEVLLPYKPYKEQSIQLPITLNAIPVSSGGNVTINGQQYISDRLVEKDGVYGIERNVVDALKNISNQSIEIDLTRNNTARFRIASTDMLESSLYVCICNILPYGVIWNEDNEGVYTDSQYVILRINKSTCGEDEQTAKDWLISNINKFHVYACLKNSKFEPLSSDVQEKLKMLSTYYPVTNISVNSEQVEGYAVFNYPISMANGWNYVKQQLNDNRDYIYDMDLQSAEAYVNSEYAVTLTELEV